MVGILPAGACGFMAPTTGLRARGRPPIGGPPTAPPGASAVGPTGRWPACVPRGTLPTMTTATLTGPAASRAPAPAPDEPLTVLIADDHPLFRRGIARAIRRHPGLKLVGEATDGREALALIAALRPDVAVLDHRMPELSGVDVCAHLRLTPEAQDTAVLLLSAFEDPEIVSAAVGSGAAGYVGKTASQGEICEAIARVGRGGIAYTAAAARGVDQVFRERPHRRGGWS